MRRYTIGAAVTRLVPHALMAAGFEFVTICSKAYLISGWEKLPMGDWIDLFDAMTAQLRELRMKRESALVE